MDHFTLFLSLWAFVSGVVQLSRFVVVDGGGGGGGGGAAAAAAAAVKGRLTSKQRACLSRKQIRSDSYAYCPSEV